MNDAIENILKNNPAIWRAGEVAKGKQESLSTGFPALDAALPNDGWPQNTLIEVITPCWGMGELTLFLPLLKQATANGNYAVLISPPYIPYAPGFLHQQMPLENIIIMPKEKVAEHTLWILEKVLRTQACGVAIAWPGQLPEKSIRRLQLAAEKGNSLGIIFHHRDVKASPAALRIRLTTLKNSLQIDILKARGASRFKRIQVDLF